MCSSDRGDFNSAARLLLLRYLLHLLVRVYLQEVIQHYQDHACCAEKEGQGVELGVGYHFGGWVVVRGVEWFCEDGGCLLWVCRVVNWC